MRSVHPRHFLDDQFPVSARQIIPTVLQSAYEAVRETVRTETYMQVETMAQNEGRLMSVAVDFGLERAIKNGSLPFDYSWEKFAKPTGKYLAIRPSHSVVTVSLTKTPNKQPRSVRFREAQKVVNAQLDLLDSGDKREVDGLPHIILLHGYWGDGFAHLGIPRADCDYDFSYRTENLFNLPHATVPEGPAPEGPGDDHDFEAIGLLKEDIDRWRRDSDGS